MSAFSTILSLGHLHFLCGEHESKGQIFHFDTVFSICALKFRVFHMLVQKVPHNIFLATK